MVADPPAPRPMRVAVVGSGLSGLSAVWFLKQHSGHEVNIYEASGSPGGILKGMPFWRDKEEWTAEVGLPGFTAAGSPTLLELIRSLGLDTRKTDMTLETVRDDKDLETAYGPKLLNPLMWRLNYDILRWHYCAEATDDMSLELYLKRENYSVQFFADYLFPMMCRLWHVNDERAAMDMPAGAVIEGVAAESGLDNPWLAVHGGASSIVDKIASIVPPENLHLNAEIVSVTSHEYGVRLVERGGANHIYDHVILAVPSDRALKLLEAGGWASEEEKEALSEPQWTGLDVDIDVDAECKSEPAAVTVTVMTAPPPYNESSVASSDVSLTYNLERTQGLPGVNVTVKNKGSAMRVPHRMVGMVGLTESVQNTRRISYIGGWTGRAGGTAEDAVASALKLVRAAPFYAKTNMTTTVPTRRRGMFATLARIVLSYTEHARRFLCPLWAVIAWPMAIALAVVEMAARPFPAPVRSGVHNLHVAWSSL